MDAAGSRDRPILSIVVVVFNMEREAPRTLFTLTPEYQNVSPDLYEVIVVDNGSRPPLGDETVRSICRHFRYVGLDPAQPSPAAALNRGAREARGRLLGFMVDGARMLSPGVLQYALRASQCYRHPLVSTLGFHLGHEPQPVSVPKGYDQRVEDELLESVDWRRDGYELFRIASFAMSSRHGWWAPIAESNCVFVTGDTFHAIGGFDERFDLPGGGLVNLDFYRRACEHPPTELVVLLGEGSFHQFHGGAMTGGSAEHLHVPFAEYDAQYRRIRGENYTVPVVKCDYLGHAPPAAHPTLLASFERLTQFTREMPDAARAWESAARPPNRLASASFRPRTIIVLGMHRSGTSMLTGSLQQAGLTLGDVVTEAPHNVKGNRENRAVMFMQEDLLKCNGGSWDSPPAVVKWESLHLAVRDLFISRFRAEKLWGFKDPRTLLTLDGWLEALPTAEFVGIFRHPALVARSLNKRNGLPIERGLALWQAYNVRLLQLHRKRAFPLMEFHDDAGEVCRHLSRVTRQLELPFQHQAPTFFEDGLRSKMTGSIVLPAETSGLYEELKQRAQL
jgi:glycosyltransferase involved in cell wall biosynthesis